MFFRHFDGHFVNIDLTRLQISTRSKKVAQDFISSRAHHDSFLDGTMSQHFAQSGAFAAAANEDAFRTRMHEHRRVHQRLVLCECVQKRTENERDNFETNKQ